MVWAGTWDPSCAREEPVFKAQQREPLVPQAEHPMPSGHLLSPKPLLVEGPYGAPTDILPNSAPVSIVSAFAPWESVSGGFLECRLGDHGGEVKKGGVTGGFGDPRLGFCLHFFLQAMRHITSRLCVFIFSFGTWR